MKGGIEILDTRGAAMDIIIAPSTSAIAQFLA